MGKPKVLKYGGNDKQFLQQIKEAATLLRHASNTTRLQIILMLSNREMNVGEVCRELDMSQGVVTYHLEFLSYGGIVDPRRQGARYFYSLTERGDLLVGLVKKISA